MKFAAMTRRIWSGGRERIPSEFQTLFAELHEAPLRLAQTSKNLEDQFLGTTSELEALTKTGDDFVKQVEKLVRLASGQDCDSSLFNRSAQLIAQSIQFLVDCRGRTIKMLEQLRGYNAQIEYLLGLEAELHRSMLPLKFIQTLFKTESAPLGMTVQQMFTALTLEIEGLNRQVQEIFGEKFKQLEQARQTVSQVIVRLEKQADSLREITTVRKSQIEASMANLQKELSSNKERDVRLAHLSKELARQVEQVVIGVQFQDIVNQKMQHVAAALPEIEAKSGEFTSATDSVAASEALQFLHQSSRLQARQIKSAQEELAGAEKTIRRGIETVLTQITELDSQCLSLQEFKLLTTSFDGMVQVLVETIEEVRTQVEATVASASDAYELLRPVGNFASGLTGVVRGLSAQIHLIGLNAQVQAVQAARSTQNGRGAGLEILSARTSEISEETNRLSEQAACKLDALVAGLASVVSAFEQLRTEALEQRASLGKQGRVEEQQLHAFRDDALETLRLIGGSLDQIRGQTQRALDAAQFSEIYQVELPALEATLAANAAAAERLLQSRNCRIDQTNLVEKFQREYTMESERQVFAAVATASRIDSPETARLETSPDVELFADSPADDQIPTSVTPAENGPSKGEQTQTGQADLGTNVELF